MNLPAVPQIITERPEGMPFDEYKLRRRASNMHIRKRIRNGFMAWDSTKGTFVGETKDI
jgi:hypothetical protein